MEEGIWQSNHLDGSCGVMREVGSRLKKIRTRRRCGPVPNLYEYSNEDYQWLGGLGGWMDG